MIVISSALTSPSLTVLMLCTVWVKYSSDYTCDPDAKLLTYTGTGLYNPDFVQYVPEFIMY